jgi:tuftelin-interacting protein 11
MLAKMGWESGTGLGAEGRGIVVPIESKLRPKNMGIAFKGFGERTEQSKAEARRRGEVVSDDEEEERKKKASKAKEKAKKGSSDAWKKPKKVKTKIEHKTYEQIVAEVGEDVAGPSGLGVIIDATGATVSILLSIDNWQMAYSLFSQPREVSSLAEVSTASWTPSTDSTRLPEIRHNIRLITEATTRDLESLAREAKEVQKRRQTLQDEEARLKKRIDEEAERVSFPLD